MLSVVCLICAVGLDQAPRPLQGPPIRLASKFERSPAACGHALCDCLDCRGSGCPCGELARRPNAVGGLKMAPQPSSLPTFTLAAPLVSFTQDPGLRTQDLLFTKGPPQCFNGQCPTSSGYANGHCAAPMATTMRSFTASSTTAGPTFSRTVVTHSERFESGDREKVGLLRGLGRAFFHKKAGGGKRAKGGGCCGG